ncbi:MAG: signal peptide peptidase SppA [Gemmatimonadota bacterium]
MRRLFLILFSIAAAITLVLVVGFLLLRPLLETRPGADFDAPAILSIELDGLVVERSPPDLLSAQFEGAKVELVDVALSLERAAHDDRIAGVLLQVGAPGYGWAKAEEMRARLERFRESGKFVYAFVSPTNELGYYVALAADSIFLLPDGLIELNGFRAETPFISGTLDKLGLDPQVEAIGVYKSAADMFRRSNMSDEHREVTTGILDEHYGRFVDAVVESRGVDRADFREAFDQGVYLARELVDLGLVDGELYADEVRRLAIAEGRGVDPEQVQDDELERRIVEVGLYADDLPDRQGRPAGSVGLVYLVGAITGGESRYDPVFGRVMGAETVVEMLRDVAADEGLDAVVLRIDSPGGDAIASEQIWAAIERLAEQLPVVISMGDVAASGGYYIAAAGDWIVASPSTITGSIGVFGVIFNAQETWDKLGVSWDSVKTNPAADFPTMIRPLNETERETFRSVIADIYRSFVERVAEGREMSVAEVDRVAQGRVWTGAQALRQGLVDAVGGLDAALAAAREEAGIAADAPLELRIYPAPEGLVERLRDALALRSLGEGAAPRAAAGVEQAMALAALGKMGDMVTGLAAALREGPMRPLAVLPYVPDIR